MEREKTGLTAGEWNIMECLWKKRPQTIMQLVREMKEKTGWTKSTTNTMVKRMEAKGLLYYESDGKARQYYPALERETAAMKETTSLLNRVYRGSVGMMMSTLVENRSFTREELQELQEILRRAGEEEHG